MMFESFIQIILVAISYYLFSNEFFRFVADIKREKIAFSVRFLSFFVIYTWFVIASLLELPLVVNWFVFLILLGVEVHVVFGFRYLTAYTLSMFCIIIGLAINVLFRSLAAIFLNVPLNLFDKEVSVLKVYPIFLGFMAMAVLFIFLRHLKFASELENMLLNRKSLIFYAWTEVGIYLFLMIQLLIFTLSGDSIGIKTWGMKSSIFSILVLVISIIYSLRVASLHYYMDKEHQIRSRLIQEKKDINKLWKLAFTDMLTGCNNRHLLDRRLKEYAGYGGRITLAFIDVDGLKAINDQYGHLEGDHYLTSIAKILLKVSEGLNIDLFRYGGDEFVMISNTLSVKDITRLLIQTNELLKDDQHKKYKKSVSYGVVHGECSEYLKLIAEADDIMYKGKRNYYEKKLRRS